MPAAIHCAALLLAQFLVAPTPPVVVTQNVEAISILHLPSGRAYACFWGHTQGDWNCLAVIPFWSKIDRSLGRVGDLWVLSWVENPHLYRTVTTECWVESWQSDLPWRDKSDNFWKRDRPGLRQPPRAEP